jgi:hypothetical protein
MATHGASAQTPASPAPAPAADVAAPPSTQAPPPPVAAPASPSAVPSAPPPPAAVDAEAPKVAPVRAYAPPPPLDPGPPVFLFMPFLGIHSFQNDSARALDAGLRVGALLGGRVNEVLSLDVVAALDVLNPNGVPAGVDVTALQFHIAFSPLIHARSGGAEIVVGPKLGLFALSEDASSGTESASESAHGWLYGFNFGIFGAANDTLSVGGLVSFDVEKATEICASGTGVPEMCQSVDPSGSAKVLGVAFALLM